MINVKELRIGSYILADFGKVDGVKQIEVFQINESGVIYDEHSNEHCDVFLQPIPLTEEWLLKFRFENMDKYINTIGQRINGKFGLMRCDWSDGECSYNLFRTPNGDLTYFRHGDIPVIEHVHQLQNLFFSLTGTELTIKE